MEHSDVGSGHGIPQEGTPVRHTNYSRHRQLRFIEHNTGQDDINLTSAKAPSGPPPFQGSSSSVRHAAPYGFPSLQWDSSSLRDQSGASLIRQSSTVTALAIQPPGYPVVQMDCSSQFHGLPSTQLGVPLITQPNVVTTTAPPFLPHGYPVQLQMGYSSQFFFGEPAPPFQPPGYPVHVSSHSEGAPLMSCLDTVTRPSQPSLSFPTLDSNQPISIAATIEPGADQQIVADGMDNLHSMTVESDEEPSPNNDALENPFFQDTCAADDIFEKPPTQDTSDQGTSTGLNLEDVNVVARDSSDLQGTSINLSLEDIAVRGESSYPDLIFSLRKNKGTEILEITQNSMCNIPEAGYISIARVVLYPRPNNDNYCYDVQVLLTSVQKGEIQSTEDALRICQIISTKGGYKFCPGLDKTEYDEQYYSTIRYHLKSVRLWDKPFKRVDSVNCLLWHKLSSYAPKNKVTSSEVLCRPCKRLHADLDHQRRRSDVSPARRIKRQQPSSRYKLKYLSPASTLKRKAATQKERSHDKAKLASLTEFDVTLEDDQSDEVSKVIERIERDCPDELQSVLEEADEHSAATGQSFRNSWERDKANCKEKAKFYSDQSKNEIGNVGNRWSVITIRIALAVYVRSPAAYEALKSFNIMQLPSKSTLQSYTGAFLHDAGACNEAIIGQVKQYKTYCQSCQETGGVLPMADGALIFDEVKVISSLIWNSRSHHLVGLAMSPQQQASLQDIFQLFDPTLRVKQTSYVLQFLWRDLTSNFDIVGPYFTSESPMKAKFVMACVFESIKIFQIHGLKTSLLVCDGGAPNLAALKSTHGHFGAYGINADRTGEERHRVKPWFNNPFMPSCRIFWLICPTHQLKNMINALFASKEGGARRFQTATKVSFGWKAIADMYKRECTRRDSGHARMIPKLREIHIIRDSWTKLNVTPAKIMQQELVLSELYQYITSNPAPDDAASVRCTLDYLEACNLLFEKGFLSHSKLCDTQGDVLNNIRKGYTYFMQWYDDLYSNDDGEATTDARFLSWQTWDLLRVCVYGMTGFAEWFLSQYPNHFISPIRLSGSAVETLFSQFKYSSGGKLSASNYAIARASHLIKHTVSTHHNSKGYRDVALDLPDGVLQKKKYGQ